MSMSKYPDLQLWHSDKENSSGIYYIMTYTNWIVKLGNDFFIRIILISFLIGLIFRSMYDFYDNKKQHQM